MKLARAYLDGLIHDELRYTPYGVDPKEVHGEDPSTLLRGRFPWRDISRAEGEGNRAVWGLSDEVSHFRGVGSVC
jgi:hypothetical protein